MSERLSAQLAATDNGALPDGEHQTKLVEVEVKRRRKGGHWLMLISQHENGRYAREMKPLTSADYCYDLTDGQLRSLKAYAARLGVIGDDPELIVEELKTRIGADVQVTIARTAHATRIRHTSPRGIVLSTVAGALTTQGEVLDPVSSHASHEKLLLGLNGSRLAMTLVAEACYELSRDDGYKALGYEKLSDYLASPEISMSRGMFFRYAAIHENYVIAGGVEPARLSEASSGKLQVPLRALTAGDVSTEEALSDAIELGIRDLRDKYRTDDEDKSLRRDCARCDGIPDEILDPLRKRYAT